MKGSEEVEVELSSLVEDEERMRMIMEDWRDKKMWMDRLFITTPRSRRRRSR